MVSCKECIHCAVCNFDDDEIEYTVLCSFFQDRSRFLELPCKVGDSYYKIQQQCTERGYYDKPKDTDTMDCELSCDVVGKCDRSYYIKENKFHSISQIVEYYERYILSDKLKEYRKIFHIKEEAEQALKNIGDKNA